MRVRTKNQGKTDNVLVDIGTWSVGKYCNRKSSGTVLEFSSVRGGPAFTADVEFAFFFFIGIHYERKYSGGKLQKVSEKKDNCAIAYTRTKLCV